MRDELLGHYERELVFLRKMGAEFARKYPKIASRLLLDEEKVEDPHVERMVEAFAFLTGRVNLKIEDEFPEITESFLNILYPHFLAPIPSMAIAQMNSGMPSDKLTNVQRVEKGSKLNSRPIDGSPCQFQTAYDVDLYPIEILSAALESPAPKNARGLLSDAYIRISMRCFGDANLHEMKIAGSPERPDHLRFYLDGDPQLVFPLYEIIFNHSTRVEFRPKEAPLNHATMKTLTDFQLRLPDPVFVPAAESIRQVGFSEDEAILPYTKRSFGGYRLLSEYFAFPYKFLFFDVYGLDQAIDKRFGSHFDLLIHLKDISPPAAPVMNETFRMGCTPIVNLFQKLAEPIYLSQQKYEYHVIPDVHRQKTTEVYSIDQVFTSDPRTNVTKEFAPFYSLRHTYGDKAEKAFWYANRRGSQRENDDGTEIYLSMVDSNFDPRVPPAEILHVRTTCTNRNLPARLPFGGKEGDFDVEGTALLSRARCLTKPTEAIRPPQRRSAQWRLISHLNLNYLSITHSENGEPEALREILQLYNFDDSSVIRNQILGIKNIETRRVVRQVGGRIGAGFVRGMETTLTFDEEQFVGSGMYLFACILERFLALYSSLNSFNQLVVRTEQREDIVKRFPTRSGEQILI